MNQHSPHSENSASDARPASVAAAVTTAARSESCLAFSDGRAALVMAHPGHELRVYGWLAAARPVVCILTDGSGHTRQSRLASTTRILETVGATPGDIYGASTDAAVYRACLAHDHDFFFRLADNLAETLVHHEIDYLAGDATEGYNPGHDVCRMLINAAIELAQRVHHRTIRNYDFLLMALPDECPAELRDRAYRLRLDDPMLERKLAAARAYPEISSEVDSALSLLGTEAFRVECLRPVADLPTGSSDSFESKADEPPFYERHGEQQVATGYYQQVIRYRQHLLPLADALRRHAEGRPS